jgi:hypothetical protein
MREAAYVEGSFYKNLLTGRLRTRNPLYLAMLLGGAVFLLAPLACTLVELASGAEPSLFQPGMAVCGGIIITVFTVGGAAFLANFILSMRQR